MKQSSAAAPRPRSRSVAVEPTYTAASGAVSDRLLALACLLLLAIFVGQFLSAPTWMWPDTGCQAYYAWRVSLGDVLYRDLWEPHPPAMIFFASLFYRFLPTSLFTIKLTLVLIAGVIGAITGHAVVRFAKAKPMTGILTAIAVALLEFTGLLALRPEATLALCSVGTVHMALLGLRNESKWRTLVLLSGLFAGGAICSKPGGAAAWVIALFIWGFGAGKLQPIRAIAFGAASGILPVLWLLWMLLVGAIPGAWDNIVVYGKSYFPAPTLSRMSEVFLMDVTTGGGPLLISIYIALLATVPMWWRRFTDNKLLFGIVFLGWPCLEIAVTLPQTTAFTYVSDNLYSCVLYLLFISAGMLSTSPPKPAIKALYVVLACGLFLAKVLSLPLALLISGLVALLLWMHLTDRWRKQWTGAAFLCSVVLALLAFPGQQIYRSQVPLSQLRFEWRHDPEYEFSKNQLTELKKVAGGKLLAFWICPSPAYFAEWELALKYHVVIPLFISRNYGTSERWREVAEIIDRPDTHVMIDWPLWYDMTREDAEMQARMVPEYFEAVRRIKRKFQLIKTIDVGYRPIRIWADAQVAPIARTILQ